MEKIMRSIIYVDCAKEEYRIKLHYWLYHTHVPESISQFQPYVSKYAFYECLPVPDGGENYGTIHKQLTEHYWQANPMDASMAVKVFTETFPTDVLIWQKNLPESSAEQNFEGDDARATKVSGCNPFIFAFIPMSWEEDFKGTGRTTVDGPNYRWNFSIGYPEGVSIEEEINGSTSSSFLHSRQCRSNPYGIQQDHQRYQRLPDGPYGRDLV